MGVRRNSCGSENWEAASPSQVEFFGANNYSAFSRFICVHLITSSLQLLRPSTTTTVVHNIPCASSNIRGGGEGGKSENRVAALVSG